ncbi:gamma-tubulin complex component 6 [Bacillus rossius redtenbacheri]|uniref:gamma-tubulin complex component 6 n=1 Tax=Bacillus rossius redtenbacheri TaxID=93214 RepID=UPI002FDDCC11
MGWACWCSGRQRQAERLHGCVDRALRDGLCRDPGFVAALRFLLAYVEGGSELRPAPQDVLQDHLDEFRLPYNSSYAHVRPYREIPPEAFAPPEGQVAPQVNYAVYQFLPASDRFPFSAEPGSRLPLLGLFTHRPALHALRQTGLSSVDSAFSIPELSSPRGLRIPKPPPTSQEMTKDEGYGTPSQECAEAEPGGADAWGPAPRQDTRPGKEPCFLLEVSPEDMRHACLAQALEQLHSQGSAPPCPRHLPRALLLSHLRYLAAGIESTTFVYNQDVQAFEIQQDVCMEGMAPGTFSSLCEDFLACGTLCRRLQGLACAGEPAGGLVYKVRAARTAERLGCARADIVHFPKTRGDGLKEGGVQERAGLPDAVPPRRAERAHRLPDARARSLLEVHGVQLACLRDVLDAGPRASALLARLCGQLRAVSRADLACLLCSVLLSCCRAYFSFLEKWIFEGECSDVYGEFFIQAVPEWQSGGGRSYWSRGFSLDEAEVPCFLRGLHDSVLQCAKTVALLKLCSPKDPLCVAAEHSRPGVRCCATQAGLERLQARFARHEAACQRLCGEPVSVRQLLQRADVDLGAVQRARAGRLLCIQRAGEARAAATRDGKRRLLAEQREQMELAQARRLQLAQREREEEEARRQAREPPEEQRLVQSEREALVQFYGLLTEATDKIIRDAQMAIEEVQDNARHADTGITLPSPNNNSQENALNIANIVHSTHTDDHLNNPIITTPNGNVHFPDPNSNEVTATRLKEDVDNANAGVDLICHKLDAAVPNINVQARGKRRDPPGSLPLTPWHSEAQRNKHRALYEDFGMGGVVTGEAEARRKSLAPDTDLERNRNRVLQSSIGIGLRCKEWPATSVGPDTAAVLRGDDSSSTGVNAVCVGASPEVSEPAEPVSPDVASDVQSSEAGTATRESCVDVEQGELEPGVPVSPSVGSDAGAATRESTQLPRTGRWLEDFPEVVDIAGHVLGGSVTESPGRESPDALAVLSALRRSVLVPLQAQARLANAQLLRHLLVDCSLLSHLLALHRFFFLLDGEFSRTLTTDLLERMYRARRPMDMLNVSTLGAVLARALAACSTPNGSHLSFRVNSVPDVFKHASPSVLSCLALHYHVAWPLDIVISGSALDKYNAVFGFLLKLRRISWVMEQDFHWLKGVRLDRGALLASPQYHSVQLWRHDMMHVVCALQSYLLGVVHHHSWTQLQRGLEGASTLDQLCRLHALYLRQVLQRCFLDPKSQPMEVALQNLCRVILKFHGVLRGQQWARVPGAACYTHPSFPRLGDTYKAFRHLCHFVYHLCVKIATHGYQTHVLCLLQLLNMNGYYGDEGQVDHGGDP